MRRAIAVALAVFGLMAGGATAVAAAPMRLGSRVVGAVFAFGSSSALAAAVPTTMPTPPQVPSCTGRLQNG